MSTYWNANNVAELPHVCSYQNVAKIQTLRIIIFSFSYLKYTKKRNGSNQHLSTNLSEKDGVSLATGLFVN